MQTKQHWPRIATDRSEYERRAKRDAAFGEVYPPWVDSNAICPMCKNQNTQVIKRDEYRCSCDYEWTVVDATPQERNFVQHPLHEHMRGCLT